MTGIRSQGSTKKNWEPTYFQRVLAFFKREALAPLSAKTELLPGNLV
jgi:hypothetical protein